MKPDPLYIWLAALALYFGILAVVCLITPGHTVCLEETMNATGQGYHSLEVAQEVNVLLGPNHNVSLSGLITFQNGSTWSIVKCNETKKEF
jgi:hypothetical protein